MSSRTKLSGLSAALVLLPGYALANTGVSVLFLTVGGIVLALIPIVIIETLVVRNQITISRIDAAWSVTVANIVSTLAGVGLAFLILVAEVPILSDDVYGETASNLWSLVIFVPMFFLSVAIELPVVRKMNKSVDRQALQRAIILANAGSYLLMSAFLVARIIKREILYGGWFG